LLDQKVAKSQGFPKMAENRRAFWLEETKVVTFSPLLKTDVQKSPVHLSTIIANVSSLFYAACFLNAIFERPVLSQLLFNDKVKHIIPPVSQIGMEANNPVETQFLLFFVIP
jgi:hypothetical protein